MDEGKEGTTGKMERMEEQLKEWGIDIEKMKSRANKAKAEVKAEIDQEVSMLRARLNEAQRNLEELKSEGTAASAEMKKGAENAWVELRKAFDSARTKFK